MKQAKLILDNGVVFNGYSFGYETSINGEVVFNTAMTGYTESLTDPSYAGQILTFTYPLIGNYGVPSVEENENQMASFLESNNIHPVGIIVTDYSEKYNHWNAKQSLSEWLKAEKIPAITGIDTRELTKTLRESGVMMGRIVVEGCDDKFETIDYDNINFVEKVSCKEVIKYNEGAGKKVVLVDCGVKNNIIRCLINQNVEVIRVPWNYDYTKMDFDGLFLANGPGSPETCIQAVDILKAQMSNSDKPICGICMGNQLLGKASGAEIYKLKYGHRSHNQPVQRVGTNQCFITSQNHGYALNANTLGKDWEEFFVNLNDGSNEGIRHKTKAWFSTQFHPEACGGPTDTEFVFQEFVKTLK